jgi:hypothetical protein
MRKLIFALTFLALTTTTIHAAPSAQPTCRLRNETREIVVIVSGPCWQRDFAPTCQLPARISKGMRIYCPAEKPPQAPTRM